MSGPVKLIWSIDQYMCYAEGMAALVPLPG